MNEQFLKWFNSNETRFHQGQFDDKQIAWAAWLAAIEEVKKIMNADSYIELNDINKE